jgi:hypothetical protein
MATTTNNQIRVKASNPDKDSKIISLLRATTVSNMCFSKIQVMALQTIQTNIRMGMNMKKRIPRWTKMVNHCNPLKK